MTDFPEYPYDEALIFDSHAHYDDAKFDDEREALLAELPSHGVCGVVNCGCDTASSKTALKLADSYGYIYAAVGIHPENIGGGTVNEIRTLAKHQKCVAIGEIGLDYYWDKESHDLQKTWFVRQLHMAQDAGLPVIIHSREAAKDTFDILKAENSGKIGGVIHCYSYSKEMAQEYIKMGFYIGVGGVVTFKNAKKLKEVVENIPLTSIVLETDCPYMAPEPNRGKRNNSAYIRYVAEKIAELKGITYEEVVEQTEKNARDMYRL